MIVLLLIGFCGMLCMVAVGVWVLPRVERWLNRKAARRG